MQDKQPRDKNGDVIGIGDILIVRSSDKVFRYKVLAVDHLQGSGAVKIECLDPVEPGFERQEISRYWLCRLYEIER